MINWEAMCEAITAGLIIVCFAAIMTFAVFWGLHKIGVKPENSHHPCTCTCHVMEGKNVD